MFQKEVLGSPECPSQWKILFKTESNGSIQIEPIHERNTVMRGMLNYIEKITQGAVPDSKEVFKAKLIFACLNYSEAMKILTTHRALTDEEILCFQDLVDDFFEAWIELFGNNGVTNYLHLLSSSHVIYSQQGWEA